jgi:hypothetical protein
MLEISHSRGETMPQSTHNRLAEIHNFAEHSHDAAAPDKADHLTPHELTKQAEEHSEKSHERDRVLAAKFTKRNKA